MEKLPKNVEISFTDIMQYFVMDEDLGEAICGYLSDKYGYCINNFDYSIKISNIDWDTKED